MGGRDGEKGRETLEEWKEREKEKCSRGKRERYKRGREENERERDKKKDCKVSLERGDIMKCEEFNAGDRGEA